MAEKTRRKGKCDIYNMMTDFCNEKAMNMTMLVSFGFNWKTEKNAGNTYKMATL